MAEVENRRREKWVYHCNVFPPEAAHGKVVTVRHHNGSESTSRSEQVDWEMVNGWRIASNSELHNTFE